MLKLSIPTSYNDSILKGIEKINNKYCDKSVVAEVFGSIPNTLLGTGRGYSLNPHFRRKKIFQHIEKCANFGISFNLIINAPCFGDILYNKKYEQEISTFFDEISSYPVSLITMSNPLLIDYVTKNNPIPL